MSNSDQQAPIPAQAATAATAATATTVIASKTPPDVARVESEPAAAPSPRTRRRGVTIPNDVGNSIFPSPNRDLEGSLSADRRRAPKLADVRTQGESRPEQKELSRRVSSSDSGQLSPPMPAGANAPSPVVDVVDIPMSAISGASPAGGQVPKSRASLPGAVSSSSLPHQPSSPVSRRPRVLSWKSPTPDHLSVPKPAAGLGTAPKDSVASDASGRQLGILHEHPVSRFTFSLSEEQEEGTPLAPEMDRRRSVATPSTSNSQLLVPAVRVNSKPAHTFLGEEVFRRKIDAERDAEEINKASCYIEDALEGRYKHGKGSLISQPVWKRRCFDVHTSFAWAGLIYSVNIAFAFLILIEPPTTCTTPPWVHGAAEMLCLLILCSDIALKITYMGKTGYLSKKWHKLSCALLLLFVIDLVLFLSLSRPCNSVIRIARPLRPWLLLARNRRLRRVVDTTVRMALPLLRIFFAMALFIFLFAWIGVHLYQDVYHEQYIVDDTCPVQTCANMSAAPSTATSRAAASAQTTSSGVSTPASIAMVTANGSSSGGGEEAVRRRAHAVFQDAFDNPLNASLHLFVLLTSENYPYIMEPALAATRANFAYFIIYFIACIQLTALNLAVIVQFWIAHLSSIGLAEKRKQRLGLAKAFMLLDPQGNGFITEERWSKVVCRLKSDMDRLKAKFVFDLLDFEQKGCLDILDFLNISELFNIDIKQLDLEEIQKPIPFWKASLRSFLYAPLFTVRDCRIYMNHLLLMLVIIHSLLVSVYYRGLSPAVQANLHIACSVIVAVFAAEILAKLLAGGEHKYVVAGNAALVSVAIASMTTYWAVESSQRSIPGLIWGLAVTLRVFWLSRTFQFLLLYLTRVSRVTFWQVAVTAGFIYTLSDIGMQSMAQDPATFRNSSAEQCSSFAPEDRRGFNRYPYDCSLGFDSVYCAMHSMMQIVTTNDWHVQMFESAAVAGEWAIAYYIATYVIIHYVFINLMVAIAIEMFLLAIKTKFFSTVESRLVETHVASFEVVAESSHSVLKTVRKRSNSIVRGHVAPGEVSLDPTPLPSAIDLEDFASARQKTVVLQISKKNHSLVEEFKSFIEDDDFEETELTNIQKLYDNMMKKSQRSDSLTTAQGCFDAVALQREKKLARARLERPDLLIYALASIRGRGEFLRASGCLVLEVDGHANVASFSCTVKGLTGFVTDSYIHTSEKTTPMFILPEFEYDPDRGIYSSHGVWKLKHVDRAMLLSERSIVTLCTQQHPQGECGGVIRVEEEITQWEVKKKDLKAKCEQFSKISPILTLYAHRVEKRTLEDMLMNRQGHGDHAPSSPCARTDGDGQSSPSMTSILTEWKASTHSIQQEAAAEPTAAPGASDAAAESSPPREVAGAAAARNGEAAFVGSTPDEASGEAATDGERLLPAATAAKDTSDPHPKSTSFSMSDPGAGKAGMFSRMRRQVHSDPFLTGEAKPGEARKRAKTELPRLGPPQHKPSKFSVIENLVNTENRRRLVSHGSLFVSPDVQSIERLTSTKRKSKVHARSEARRKWQRLAMLRVNKVGIAPTTQQQRIINEEIKKPEVDEVASKTSTSSVLKRTTSVASAMLKTLSTAARPNFQSADLSSPVRQNAKRGLTAHQRPSTPRASSRRGSLPVAPIIDKPLARPKTAGLAHSRTQHHSLEAEDTLNSLSDTQLSARQGAADTAPLLPRQRSGETATHTAAADHTESNV